MLGVVNDQNYFGFLGQYYLKNNKINLKPISLSFFEDKILQSF